MVSRILLVAALVLAARAIAAPAVASAQTQDATVTNAEAAALFRRGVVLGEQHRWGEAYDLFRRSEALVHRPTTLFNIAYALFRLGRFAQAVERFDEYLALPETTDARHADATRLRAEGAALLAEVTLELRPATVRVYVDGAESSGRGAERALRLDPGVHRLVVRADGFEEGAIALQVAAGERSQRTVHLVPLIAPVTPTPAISGGERDDASFVAQPVFWVTVVGSILLVAGGIALGVALTAEDAPPPYGGSSGVVFEALSF